MSNAKSLAELSKPTTIGQQILLSQPYSDFSGLLLSGHQRTLEVCFHWINKNTNDNQRQILGLPSVEAPRAFTVMPRPGPVGLILHSFLGYYSYFDGHQLFDRRLLPRHPPARNASSVGRYDPRENAAAGPTRGPGIFHGTSRKIKENLTFGR
jgi:hypothetical protein